MKSFILILITLFASCSFSKKDPGVVDSPKTKDYYEQNHTCDSNEEELNKLSWISKKPFVEKMASDEVKRGPSSNEDLYDMIGKGCDDLDRSEIDEQARIASLYGRELISPMDYPETVAGLQKYLNDVGGIKNFKAEEMVRPNNLRAARQCKMRVLLPLKCRWAGAVAQALMAEKFREIINDNGATQSRIIRLRNWYRPRCYNSKVGGAKFSDHRWSRGFDLDFASARDRAKAQRYLCRLYKDEPFNLQVGIGCRTLHVGVGSPRGTRFWTYGSLRNCPLKRLSGDDCWQVDRRGTKYIHTDRASSGAL